MKDNHGFVKSFYVLKEFDSTKSKTKEEIIDLIKELPINYTLRILSYADMLLYNNPRDAAVVQKKLLDLFFNKEKEQYFLDGLIRGKYHVIFHSQQIYLFIIYLLKYGNEKTELSEKEVINKTGEILIYLNDHCDMEFDTKDHVSKAIQRKRLVGYLWSLGHLTYAFHKDMYKELTITYSIFKEYSTEKLENNFSDITGLTLEKYWAVSFALFASWSNQDPSFHKTIIDKNNYFENCSNVNDQEIEKVFKLLGGNLKLVKSINKETLENFNKYPHNFEAIRIKPVIEIEKDNYICTSLPYLVHKITTGVLEDLRFNLGSIEYTDRIGEEVGNMYEDYVWDKIDAIYNQGTINRAFNESYKNTEIADAVIDYGEDLIFIEVKAMFIQKKYRLSAEYKSIERGLKKFLINKGAKQLNDRIDEFKKGKIKIKEIDENNIKRYWPILITCTDEIPLIGILEEEYQNILNKYDILQDSYVKPLTIINLEELMTLLEYIKKGKSLVDILIGYHDSSIPGLNSIINYLLEESEISNKYSSELKEKFDQISNRFKKELGFEKNNS